MALPKQPLYGLKQILMGELASDGGFAPSLAGVSYAIIDTPVIQTEEGEKTDWNIEQSDDPYFSRTTPGVTTLTASFYGVEDIDTLVRFFGGTKNVGASGQADSWDAPASFPTIERSFILEHQSGGHIKIARASVAARLVWNFQKNNLPQFDITATILTPTKPGVKALQYVQGVYPTP